MTRQELRGTAERQWRAKPPVYHFHTVAVSTLARDGTTVCSTRRVIARSEEDAIEHVRFCHSARDGALIGATAWKDA